MAERTALQYIGFAWRRLSTGEHVCEPPHDKTNKMACAPIEDSDQPGHPPSLVRVFAVHMKKAWVQLPIERTVKTLIRLGGCPGRSESSRAQSYWWFCHAVAHFQYKAAIHRRTRILFRRSCQRQIQHNFRNGSISFFVGITLWHVNGILQIAANRASERNALFLWQPTSVFSCIKDCAQRVAH